MTVVADTVTAALAINLTK